jgi:hypothetical protein
VFRHERGRDLQVDVLRAGDDQRVSELPPVLEEPAEPPRSVVELLGRQSLVRVQRLEDRKADFSLFESGVKRHGKRLFGRSARLLDP